MGFRDSDTDGGKNKFIEIGEITMAYKVTVKGKEITYDAYTEFSRHTEEEWFAICLEMMKQERPYLYEKRKKDKDFVLCIGMAIDLEQRYEALLELLPQSAYSKAGTHPRWVSQAVDENTLDKGITQDDVKAAIEGNDTYEGLAADLADYFAIELKNQEPPAVSINILGVKCDNPECDFLDGNVPFSQYAEWVNKPCPKCGWNLLTNQDYEQVKELLAFVKSSNQILGNFDSGSGPSVSVPLNMNGSGKIIMGEPYLTEENQNDHN